MQTNSLNASLSGPSTETVFDEESRPLLSKEEPGTQVYTRRWYLLLVFSLCCTTWTLIWATWGPIAQSAEAAFNWGDDDIALFIWMGNVPFAALCIPLAWMLDYKGLRKSMILATFLMALGAGIRCFVTFTSPTSPATTWLVNIGQFLNGVSGPVTQGGGALFSNLWFPPNQRATATAISTLIGYMGNSLAFVLGPSIVPSPMENTSIPDPSGNFSGFIMRRRLMFTRSVQDFEDGQDFSTQHTGILRYLYYQAGGAGLLFLLVLIYFPDKPPRPPSNSAASEREEFKPGLAKLIRNKQYWLIALAYSLPLGIFEVWDIVLDINLDALGISQEAAGWLGFYCVVGGCVTGLVISRFADIFFRQMKLFMILFYVVSDIFILWFILIYIEVLPFDMVSIYAAIIMSGVFLDGCSPLFYELVCEAAYPVGEGVASCFLHMLCFFAGILFASVQQIPNVGTTWMNWSLLVSITLAVPMLVLMKDTFGRADLDDKEVIVSSPADNPSTQSDNVKVDIDKLTESLEV